MAIDPFSLPEGWSIRFSQDGAADAWQHRAALFFRRELRCQLSIAGAATDDLRMQQRLLELALNWIAEYGKRWDAAA